MGMRDAEGRRKAVTRGRTPASQAVKGKQVALIGGEQVVVDVPKRGADLGRSTWRSHGVQVLRVSDGTFSGQPSGPVSQHNANSYLSCDL
jgi:hypothetical protein